MNEKTKPVAVGDTIGWLRILSVGPKRCECLCRCGATILRETNNLRSARADAQHPKCKKCERAQRKRKNPGGGGVPGIRIVGISRLGSGP